MRQLRRDRRVRKRMAGDTTEAAMRFGTMLFWLPAIVSAAALLLLDGAIAAQRRIVPLSFAAALLAQLFCAVHSPAWIAGLLLQTLLAVYLMARMKLQG